MAVTKIWAVHDSVSRVLDYCSNPEKTRLTDLEQVLIYASNKAKTLDKGEENYAVTGINCSADTAAKEMAAVQARFGKRGGNVAYHAYQSFKPGEVTAEQCHRIGVETARSLWGKNYQVLVATHFNTGTYHNHFVINSVGMWDGKKLEAKYGVYYKLRDTSDRICKQHGLSVVQNPRRHKTSRAVYFAEKNREPTRFNLMREALDQALTMSGSWDEMSIVLRKMGYSFSCGNNHKYAVICSLKGKKNLRTFRLGEKYTKEAMEEVLLNNQLKLEPWRKFNAFMGSFESPSPPNESYYLRQRFYSGAVKTRGYLSLFRCLAIVLGLEPLYILNGEKHYEKPISAECREACRRLDRYTAETDLLARGNINTYEELQAFIHQNDRRIDEVAAQRDKIRNKQRNCKDENESAELKKQCSACTQELNRLRKQKKTAYNIIEDSLKAHELLECEYDTRLERDPYLSAREKAAIRGHFSSRDNNDYVR